MEAVTQTKYQKLFSTPLLRFKIEGAHKLNKELLAEGDRLRAQTEGVSKSNRGGWHSAGNLFENEAPCIQELKSHATQTVLSATETIGAKADISAFDLKLFAWMNANVPGGYNAPHTHPGAHWSGVYYVAQPEVETGSSGKIEFLDPRSDLPNWRRLQAPPFSAKKAFRPEPGELILFPSYLVHWVHPNETPDERVTVAFNATFRKTGKGRKA